jgi:hypothetical protein
MFREGGLVLFRIPGGLGINRQLHSSFSTYLRPCTLAELNEVLREDSYICGVTVSPCTGPQRGPVQGGRPARDDL